MTPNTEFLEHLAKRLDAIASDICGQAHMELCDEIRLIHEMVRAQEPKAAPRRQALPASYKGAVGKRRGR